MLVKHCLSPVCQKTEFMHLCHEIGLSISEVNLVKKVFQGILTFLLPNWLVSKEMFLEFAGWGIFLDFEDKKHVTLEIEFLIL